MSNKIASDHGPNIRTPRTDDQKPCEGLINSQHPRPLSGSIKKGGTLRWKEITGKE